MNTQKVAITIPNDIIAVIDKISKKSGVSRSKYISEVLRDKIKGEQGKKLTRVNPVKTVLFLFNKDLTPFFYM